MRTGALPVLSLFFHSRVARALATAIALTIPASSARAQFVVRSWLPWRTIETQHFAFHYPVELEAWTIDLARHVESIDSAVAAVVGYVPHRKTEIVVDDPYATSNGSAWPFLNRPIINLWASPPEPHEEISEFRDWGQMLVSHEFTHIAHLTRPSRNAFTRRLWEALPADIGPIALRAPRWAIEGYATYAEGRITGSGRPHGIWRAAILRQWALEGQLPQYDQLNASSAYQGGAFAYLVGSAFLEWLVQRHGDASLVDLWRRLSAKQTRSFDEAFSGVFGESPRALYGQFSAEVTGKALQAERVVHGAATTLADTGEIVQRLAWSTGDPAISHDGQRVALVQRSNTAPSRLVVWKTATEPDTSRARRDSLLLRRDPQDVPARPIYPPPKKPVATLRVAGGPPYEGPRFFRDGRILLWRYAARGDGSLSPDVYIWDVQHRRVHRVTRGASIRDADPSPDGHTAIATRCRRGWCDLVTLDLDHGAATTVLTGSPSVSFYRPRFSPDGGQAAVSVHTPDGWRVAVIDLQTKSRRDIPSRAEANQYDVSWASPTTIVVVSEEGGVANIEQRDVTTGLARSITRVTGAALAPETNPSDGSVWFLSLYSRGYDLRRTTVGAQQPRAVALDERLSPAAPLAPRSGTPIAENSTTTPRPFGLAPRVVRWLPQPEADADGVSGAIAVVSSDIIGRSEVLANLALGDKGSWRGGALDLTWRGSRPALRVSVYDARQQLSAARSRASLAVALDSRIVGGDVSLDATHTFDVWAARYRLGAGTSRVRLDAFLDGDTVSARMQRSIAFGEIASAWTQRGDRARIAESVSANVTTGQSFGKQFTRSIASVGLSTSGLPPLPISATATYGRTGASAPLFEQFAIGGMISPLVDRAVLAQRLPMPALPAGISVNTSAFAYRLSLGMKPLSPYWYAASTAPAGERFSNWNRVVGLDWSASVPQVAMAGTPVARAQLGIGESLDVPFRHRVRAYVNIVLNP